MHTTASTRTLALVLITALLAGVLTLVGQGGPATASAPRPIRD